MVRQRTLAEILSDDMGNIRPEVADLLMEPDPAMEEEEEPDLVEPGNPEPPPDPVWETPAQEWYLHPVLVFFVFVLLIIFMAFSLILAIQNLSLKFQVSKMAGAQSHAAEIRPPVKESIPMPTDTNPGSSAGGLGGPIYDGVKEEEINDDTSRDRERDHQDLGNKEWSPKVQERRLRQPRTSSRLGATGSCP